MIQVKCELLRASGCLRPSPDTGVTNWCQEIADLAALASEDHTKAVQGMLIETARTSRTVVKECERGCSSVMHRHQLGVFMCRLLTASKIVESMFTNRIDLGVPTNSFITAEVSVNVFNTMDTILKSSADFRDKVPRFSREDEPGRLLRGLRGLQHASGERLRKAFGCSDLQKCLTTFLSRWAVFTRHIM